MSLYYNSESNKSKEFGGSVFKGGNVANIQNYLSLVNVIGNYETNNFPYSSSPVELNTLSKKAIVGVFAYNRDRPLTKGSTLTLNQNHVDHDLKTPGTVDVSIDTNIHAIRYNRNRLDTTAIRNNQYDVYTGKFNEGYPVVSEDDFRNDVAASPTRSNPGLLSFTLGSNVRTQQYISKTG